MRHCRWNSSKDGIRTPSTSVLNESSTTCKLERSSSGGQRPKWPCSRPPRRELLRRLLLRFALHAHTVANQSYVPVRRVRRRATRRRRGIQGLPLVDRPEEEEPRFQGPRLELVDDLLLKIWRTAVCFIAVCDEKDFSCERQRRSQRGRLSGKFLENIKQEQMSTC